VGLTTLPHKKKIVEKLPRNSAGFCGGGQGLNWAVEPRKEKKRIIFFISASEVVTMLIPWNLQGNEFFKKKELDHLSSLHVNLSFLQLKERNY
jgi:hypothetical protein